jgi:hypothetical protein
LKQVESEGGLDSDQKLIKYMPLGRLTLGSARSHSLSGLLFVCLHRPEPAFCYKLKDQNTAGKVFVNLCSSIQLDGPKVIAQLPLVAARGTMMQHAPARDV